MNFQIVVMDPPSLETESLIPKVETQKKKQIFPKTNVSILLALVIIAVGLALFTLVILPKTTRLSYKLFRFVANCNNYVVKLTFLLATVLHASIISKIRQVYRFNNNLANVYPIRTLYSTSFATRITLSFNCGLTPTK